MANSRTRFDTIQAYMTRAHPNVTAGMMYNRPALQVYGQAFAYFCYDAMAFRLHGRLLLQAQVLPGAKGFDPLHHDSHTPGWVWLPEHHFLRWDRFTVEAYRCMSESLQGRFSFASLNMEPTRPVDPPPPPSPPTSLADRFKRAWSSLSWTTSRPGDAA